MVSMNRQEVIQAHAEHYLDPWYGMGQQRRQDVERLIATFGPHWWLLDVGTGRGETLDMAEAAGLHVVIGVEPVEYLCDNKRVFHGVVTEIPAAEKSFDVVTCFDVLEHLPASDLLPAVRELIRVSCDRVYISASELPFVYRGVEQHISRRPAAKWQELIQEAAGKRKVERIANIGDSPAWVIYA